MTQIGRPTPDPIIFRGPLGEITKRIDPYTDADPVGVHLSLLAMTGSAIGRETYINFGARHPLLVWPILLGRTSMGRKGTATDRIVDLYEQALPEFVEDRVISGMQSSGAAIVAGLARRAIRLDGPGKDGVSKDLDLVLDDAEEQEAPQETGSKRFVSKSGFRAVIIETEMKKFLARAKIDTDMSPILRKVWEGGKIDSETKKEFFRLVNPNVSVICHIPPKEFVATFSAADAAGGSMNRMFPIFVYRSKVLKRPRPLPQEVMELNAEELRAIVEFGTDLGELTASEEADELWETKVWDEIDAVINESEMMEEFAGRAMPYCWRIAGLYAVARRSSVINAADLESAYALIRYMLESVKYVFTEYADSVPNQGRKATREPFEGDPRRARPEHVKRLVEIAMEAGEEGQKTRAFTPRMNVSAEQFKHIGAAAEAAGLVERWKIQGPTGAPGYFIVYTGSDQDTSPQAEAPKPVELVEVESARRVAPSLVTVTPKRLPKPKPAISKANGSTGGDLLADFF